ncbi:hypothetical protein AVEN_111746-1 [Araneus ventricosus]|uniref:Uncharacterized protein n=1 Tax=Araneus ventricosus TaxID=182803 RepID=A0A4Y2GT97_ARAVE|nr:hypothetical protein AVEN_111746-1 [Araneus ventricosus]
MKIVSVLWLINKGDAFFIDFPLRFFFFFFRIVCFCNNSDFGRLIVLSPHPQSPIRSRPSVKWLALFSGFEQLGSSRVSTVNAVTEWYIEEPFKVALEIVLFPLTSAANNKGKKVEGLLY